MREIRLEKLSSVQAIQNDNYLIDISISGDGEIILLSQKKKSASFKFEL